MDARFKTIMEMFAAVLALIALMVGAFLMNTPTASNASLVFELTLAMSSITFAILAK